MVLLQEHMLEFVSRSHEQTQRLGARLGVLAQGGVVICLEGSLGAGKTCLAQGIGQGWGTNQRLVSPTFVLMREYTHPQDMVKLYHIDLYRISSPREAWGLGLDDFLGDEQAVCVIEWAERARELIPPEHLWVTLGFVDPGPLTQRSIHFAAHGERHQALLEEFRREAFGV